jgi:hypothetical protein
MVFCQGQWFVNFPHRTLDGARRIKSTTAPELRDEAKSLVRSELRFVRVRGVPPREWRRHIEWNYRMELSNFRQWIIADATVEGPPH